MKDKPAHREALFLLIRAGQMIPSADREAQLREAAEKIHDLGKRLAEEEWDELEEEHEGGLS